MNKVIVICFNGEPKTNLDFWGTHWVFYGPFEGTNHAKLWLEKVHAPDGVCSRRETEHQIKGLYNI